MPVRGELHGDQLVGRFAHCDLKATCPGCLAANGANHTLANNTVTGMESFEVCDTLTVGPNYVVQGPNGDLKLKAGKKVVFKGGFSVGTGGKLEVEVP